MLGLLVVVVLLLRPYPFFCALHNNKLALLSKTYNGISSEIYWSVEVTTFEHHPLAAIPQSQTQSQEIYNWTTLTFLSARGIAHELR